MCGKRLKAAIPGLVDSMERHGHLQLHEDVRRLVMTASAATIDRVLAPARNAGRQGRRRQGVNTPLRKSIAVRTFTDWKDPPPGFFEMDMVTHCGKSVAGQSSSQPGAHRHRFGVDRCGSDARARADAPDDDRRGDTEPVVIPAAGA